MKRFILLTAGMVAMTVGVASAQDWSGLYVGAHAGSASRESSWNDLDDDWGGGVQADDEESALILGGHVGYNWQHGNWVFGAQGGFSYADLSKTEFVNGDVDVDNSQSFIADARAHVGYAFGSILPYATFGAAYSDTEHSWLEIDDTDDSWQDFGNETGWVYGAGVAYAFAPNWSTGLEYVHYDFGSQTETNPLDYRMRVKTEADAIQFTLNYQLS